MWHTWAVPATRCPVGISECSLWLRGECVCVAVGHCPYFNPCICECVHTGAPSHRAAMTTCPCLLSSVPTQEAGDNGCISLHSELLLPPPHPALCGSQIWAGLGWAGRIPWPTHPDLVLLTSKGTSNAHSPPPGHLWTRQ